MGSRVPRILVLVVTDRSSWEFSTVKGRPMFDGKPSPGPTMAQYRIATRAIRALWEADKPASPSSARDKKSKR